MGGVGATLRKLPPRGPPSHFNQAQHPVTGAAQGQQGAEMGIRSHLSAGMVSLALLQAGGHADVLHREDPREAT